MRTAGLILVVLVLGAGAGWLVWEFGPVIVAVVSGGGPVNPVPLR